MPQSLSIQRGFIAVAALVLLAGCASGGRSPSAQTDRNRISETELDAVEQNTTALQLIQRARPQWLRGRGPTNLNVGGSLDEGIPVYLNHQRIGGLDVLQRYSVAEVRELRFLDSIAATQLFGTGHRSGAIVIVIR